MENLQIKRVLIQKKMNADCGFSVRNLCRFLTDGKERCKNKNLYGMDYLKIEWIEDKSKSRELTQLSADRGHPGPNKFTRIYTEKKILQRSEPDLHAKQAMNKRMLWLINRRLFATPTAQAVLSWPTYTLFKKGDFESLSRRTTGGILLRELVPFQIHFKDTIFFSQNSTICERR